MESTCEMSPYGTKRTWINALHMSAFGGKADMTFCAAHVCFGPKADISALPSLNSQLFPSSSLNRYDASS